MFLNNSLSPKSIGGVKLEQLDESSLEILEGMIWLCRSELSEKVLESLITPRSEYVSYRDLLERTATKYKGDLYWDELVNTLDELERLDIIKVEFESPPRIRMTRKGMETLRAFKILERELTENLVAPISKSLNLKEDDEKYQELLKDTSNYCIQALEKIRSSYKEALSST